MAKLQVIRTLSGLQDGGAIVAVSGGVDSMVALHFMLHNRKFTPIVLYYMHAHDANAEKEYRFIHEYCSEHNIGLMVNTQKEEPYRGSREAFWRKGRYESFHMYSSLPVITGHHLDDAVEWYLFTSFRGCAKVMPYRNKNVIRPFLYNKKADFMEYADKHNVPFIHDETNDDSDFAARNRIRNTILPEVLKVNPGIYTVVRKKIEENIVFDSLHTGGT